MRRVFLWSALLLWGAWGCDSDDGDGGGGDASPPACQEGERTCLEGSVGVCQGGAWVVESACEGACVAGACQAPCTPDCAGRACGDDGCGGVCGFCPPNTDCVEGQCALACGDGTCAPSEDCFTCPADCACEEPGCGDGHCDADEDCSGCPSDCGCAAPAVCQSGACVEVGCGDGRCAEDEDCSTCAEDCACPDGQICQAGACVGQCGDGRCDEGEDCSTCAEDCACPDGQTCQAGVCAGQCGDGRCDPAEGCASCAEDCPCEPGNACVEDACRPACGDGVCGDGESCVSCPPDCGCPDGQTCDEVLGECAGACVPDCAGRACGPDGCGDRCGECDGDLGCDEAGQCTAPPAVCGDEVCDPDEDCSRCPADCGQCCGNGACSEAESCATCPADCACAEGSRCDVEANACVPVCLPSCEGRDCGGDGCGGSCGACPWGEICDEAGACQRAPVECGDETCDPDEDCVTCPEDCGACCGNGECGGDETCADCPEDCPCGEGERCDAQANTCVSECIPQCEGRQCGDDGCDGDCGACPEDFSCTPEGQCEQTSGCGDGQCEAGEGCATCTEDCPCGAGERCDEGGNVCVPQCVPQCDGRACGPDGCGGDCGLCPEGNTCEEGRCVGACVGGCEIGALTCEADGVSYRACVPTPEDPTCGVQTRRIPCDEGRACGAEGCGGGCSRPEILLVVDRSSSMEGERWAMVVDVLGDFCARYGEVARVQLRAFPTPGAACGAGPIVSCADAFIDAPSGDGETPIAAALTGAGSSFGDPNEGEAVILITDGDETCAEEMAPIAPTRELAARGAQVFAIGVSQFANGALLDAVAEAGDTGQAYMVNDHEGLWTSLTDIYARLDGCDCGPAQSGEVNCYQGDFLVCRGATGQREPYFPSPTGTCACDPNVDSRRCVDEGIISCSEAGEWVFDGADPGYRLCVDGVIGYCGVDVNLPDGCAWMLESSDALCSDGIDNDGNGYTDCRDWSCLHNPNVAACAGARAGLEVTEALCTDGVDNDENGYADCDDHHCSRNLWLTACDNGEGSDATCADGVDNDLDGFTDCEDWDCSRSPIVTVCPEGPTSCPETLPAVELGGWNPLIDAPAPSCRCDAGAGACVDGKVFICNNNGFWDWYGYEARCLDEVEPNDARNTAQHIGAPSVFIEGVCGGIDWFSFDAVEGARYAVVSRSIDGGDLFDVALRIFDQAGAPVDLDPLYPGPEYDRLEGWLAPSTGRFWIQADCAPSFFDPTPYGLNVFPER